MTSVQKPSSGTNANDGSPIASNIDPNDPLGYDVYAKTLWDRVEHALKNASAKGKLGDDPLVIGLFGEWGVGKSFLLDQIREHARRYCEDRVERRTHDRAMGLTIPVYFQPWKYEHEEHLLVPLLLHILLELKGHLKRSRTGFEVANQAVDKYGDLLAAHMTQVVEGFEKLITAAAVATASPTAGASLVGIPAMSVAKKLAAWLQGRDRKKPDVAGSVRYTDEGRYYYEIHEHLKSITRPSEKKNAAKGYTQGVQIDSEKIEIDFVIFVDDLDRCLPEKAVAVLELIKTIFNVESFAFVLALDDEVIERGIGHRYSAYLLKDKKPQMPITGFEYLEKIVHLPFRLPALTRAQAAAFVRKTEQAIEPNAALHWFRLPSPEVSEADVGDPSASASKKRGDGDDQLAGLGRSARGYVNDPSLLPILLSSFDAYVPRKLLRAVELWHQVCRVARSRGIASETLTETRWERIHEGEKIRLDVRVIFALALLQLFQPELFRFMRRRVEAFPILLRALAKKGAVPDGLGKVECSEVELWSWASYRKGEEVAGGKRPHDEATAVALIAQLTPEDAYQAQYIRLRLAERLVEHFSVQRHVFHPLRLMHWLAEALDGAVVKQFPNLPAYFGVLAQQSELAAITSGRKSGDSPPKTAIVDTFEEKALVSSSVRSSVTPARFSVGDVDGLFDVLVATDTAARGGIAPRFALPAQQWFDAASIDALTAKFANHFLTDSGRPLSSQKMEHALGALGAVVPWLTWQNGAERIVAQLAGNETSADALASLVAKEMTPNTRVSVGDVLERFRFGDPRFDEDKPHQWAKRFLGENSEPIPGFVGVPSGPFTMGDNRELDNKSHEVNIASPFYIARTLTTVAQYAKFVEAKGYEAGADIWSAQGLQWRSSDFDSKVENKAYADYLTQRKADRRGEPWNWAAQREHPSRPVTGVTWFEARAYARWLSAKMRPDIDDVPALKNYAVMLPAEDQWERAARAKDLTSADARRWPWVGEDEKDVPQRANVSGSGIEGVSPVGVFAPNAIGLFDMAGNAWEWQDNLYASASKTGYRRVSAGQQLQTHEDLDKCDMPALRGGSWFNRPVHASCSGRDRLPPDGWSGVVGFRVVLSLASSSEV